MKLSKYFVALFMIFLAVSLSSCRGETEASKEAEKVDAQQAQYAKGQPVPAFDFSLERDLMSQLYVLRNEEVSTHAVWRADYGMIEGDCPSLGFGLPYDVSLTNPLVQSRTWWGSGLGSTIDVVEQAEPNGIFASKNTSATWVMCLSPTGAIEPHYVESKVTIYPYSVEVDYDKNRVHRLGEASVTLTPNDPTIQ